MRHLLSLLLCLSIGVCAFAQKTEIKVEVQLVEIFKDKESQEDMIRIRIKNGDRFLSYPVVVVEHKGKAIVNEGGSFDLYGISENSVEEFIFPINLPRSKRNIVLTILVGEAGGTKDFSKKVKCRLPK